MYQSISILPLTFMPTLFRMINIRREGKRWAEAWRGNWRMRRRQGGKVRTHSNEMKKLYYFSISSNFLIFLNPPIFISFSLCLEPSIYDLCSILCMWGGRKSMKYVPPSHFCIQSRTQYIAYNMSVTPLPIVQYVIFNMCRLKGQNNCRLNTAF